MSNSLFINSKKKLEFNNSDGEKLTIERGYVGAVPAWVTETWLFKAACNDSSITFIGQAKSQVEVTGNNNTDNTELLALRERAKELGIKLTPTIKAEILSKKIEEAEAALKSGNNKPDNPDNPDNNKTE